MRSWEFKGLLQTGEVFIRSLWGGSSIGSAGCGIRFTIEVGCGIR